MGTLSTLGAAALGPNWERAVTSVADENARPDTGDAEVIRVVYPDLHGVQRGKDVPVGEFGRATRHGLAFCWAVMGTDLRHTPVVGGEIGYPDMIARPDLDTLRALPWEDGVVCCLADLERDGEPEPTDVRHLVRRAEAALADYGAESKIGPELEFFVCEPDGEGGMRRHVDALSMVYTVGAQADPKGILRALLDATVALDLGAIAANHEYMNSQYEINLHERTPLEAADVAFRLKATVKEVCASRGLHATFMGKPFNDQGGSGTHMHISLEREGSNCFDGEGADGVSDELRHFTAGVLAHAPALMAFLNPTVNAFRRILPDSLAPTNVNWGFDNRTTFVRIPPDRGPACRIEVRIGDGAANPHLVIAALLFAGLDGLRRGLEPPAPLVGDAYTLPEDERGAPLPDSLEAALDALEADETLSRQIGSELVDTFVTMKRFECERHRKWVSDWDHAEYMHHL